MRRITINCPSGPPHHDTEILLDGKKVKGLTAVHFHIDNCKAEPRVLLEFATGAHIQAACELQTVVSETRTDTPAPIVPTAQDADAIEAAWGIIANVSGGDWHRQPREWQEAAARWRDAHMPRISKARAVQNP